MVRINLRRIPTYAWFLCALAGVAVVVMVVMRGSGAPLLAEAANVETHSDEVETKGEASQAKTRFVTTIRKPTGPPTINLTAADPHGRLGQVACSTCHSTREPNLENRRPADVDQFHQNMTFSHGKLACYSCHNPGDADTLRLADGSTVEYPDVMNLCAQCHGPQARDYEHGAHGGMNGYWDLTRGPRTRNNCIDCHDPHSPKFPNMLPTFKPRDRFLAPADPHHAEGQHD